MHFFLFHLFTLLFLLWVGYIIEEKYCLEETKRFYHQLLFIHKERTGKKYPFSLNEPELGIAKDLLGRVKDLYHIPPKAREIFSLFASALHYSDWLASGNIDYKYSEGYIAEKTEKSRIKE